MAATYDPGDPSTVNPNSTSGGVVFIDRNGTQVGERDPNRLTKLSAAEFERLFGHAPAGVPVTEEKAVKPAENKALALAPRK